MNQRSLVGALVALPIVTAAVVLVALETSRARAPRSDLFARR